MKTNATRWFNMASSSGFPIHAISAVPGMTLPEVRKALGHIRQLWKESTPQQPFFVSNVVHNQRTIAEFCTQFVYGHHLKRHFKSVQQRQACDELEKHAAAAADPETAKDVPPRQDGVMWWQHQLASSGSVAAQDPTQLWQGECPHVANRTAAARKRQRS